MQPQAPQNVGSNGAPGQQSSPNPTTSRPQIDQTAIAAYRLAQSSNDRLTHLSNQLGTVTNVLGNIVSSQNQQNDEQFYDKLGSQLANGEIDQAAFTRSVAERTAQRVAATSIMNQPRPQAPPQPAPAPPPAADPQAAVRQAQQIGARAIVQGLGLRGDEQGLDFTSPQALVQSGQRVLAARQQQSTGGTLNVNDAMGELGRQQGYVIPHRDGGRPAAAHPQATEADLDNIVWHKGNKNAPARTRAQLQAVRDSLAARTPSMRTGEGLLGSPNTFRPG